VVAFDVGGVREWLADSVSGFIVPEKDTAAMAEKLDLLYRDKSLAERLGKAGRESVRERFSPEQFTAAVRQLLNSVNN
jgi:glycosyltransferase involved in cell wall biosynthesis